jgi:crossover junction endodeoxyribonuclease RuvC
MILLGIDPGFADMGYGVIDTERGKSRCIAYGSVKTAASEPIVKRLARIYDRLSEIILAHRPEAVAIEKLFFSTNVKTAMLVAEARGVIRLCVEKHGLPCTEFSPADVKIAVSGHGAAAKPEVQKMVRVLLSLKETPKPDDAADALALALALASTKSLQGMIKKATRS